MPLDDNPFAPSDAARERSQVSREDNLEPVPLDPGAIIGRAWELVSKQPGLVVGALLIPVVPGLAFGAADGVLRILMEGADGDMAAVYGLGSAVVNLCNWVIALFLSLGQMRIFIHVARGQPAELAMLVGEWRNLVGGLLVQILMGLVVFLGILLLVVPGIIAGLGLQFSLYAMLDRGLGPIDALKESWRLTDGYKFTIFAVNFIIALGAIVFTCVTLGLGYIVALPILVLTQAVMYHSLTHFQADGDWGV